MDLTPSPSPFPVMLRENALRGCRGEGLDHPSHTGLNFLDLIACSIKRTQTVKWHRSGIKFKTCY